MARYWKAFATQKDRKAWEDEQKQKSPDFKVCMHYSAKDLERELFLPKGQLTENGFKFCTVYGFKDRRRNSRLL